MDQTLLTTAVFEVQRRTLTRSGGAARVTRDIIVHPGAVVILPLLSADSVVMVRNYRYGPQEELLELPAGTLEPGEAPAACAKRELEEETGYLAGRLEPFLQFFTTPGICTELMHAFIANDLTATEQRLQPDEHIRVETVSLERARKAIYEGTIRDGKTIAVLAAYLLRMGT